MRTYRGGRAPGGNSELGGGLWDSPGHLRAPTQIWDGPVRTYADLGGDILQEGILQQLCVVLLDQREAGPALGRYQALARNDIELVGAWDEVKHVFDAHGDHLWGQTVSVWRSLLCFRLSGDKATLAGGVP